MTTKEYQQIQWDEALIDDCCQLIRLAVREDLAQGFDLTTLAVVPQGLPGKAAIVARQEGVICGLRAAELVLKTMDIPAAWKPEVNDGDRVAAGVVLAEIEAPARDLLTAERIMLNFIGRLSGIATLTRRYVDAVAGTDARIYDTRKTTPAWRRLEKYAVRSGGGHNHRTGLYDAVLIKDNHLFIAGQAGAAHARTPAQAVKQAQAFTAEQFPAQAETILIEVEVDTLLQFDDVLPAAPDIILLDNMSPVDLAEAVRRRNSADSATQLEASGGINLHTIKAVADTGVDRISCGALTHSAVSLDIALDWRD